MHPLIQYIIRLLLATVCGALIGMERRARHKKAGIRTHAILALAVALFMILSKYAFFGAQGGADPTMIACQVVMGINFLGAGIILRSKYVATHGLTTAAGFWSTSAVGLAIGAGQLLLGILFTGLIIGFLILLRRFNIRPPQELRITVKNVDSAFDFLEDFKKQYIIRILSSRRKLNRGENTVTLILQAQMKDKITLDTLMTLMDQHPEVIEIKA